MKKTFLLSTFISFAMICACQKQASVAEAQRKTELDAREQALNEREKAITLREKAGVNRRVFQSQGQRPDAAQAQAEREKRIQQLPPELRALIPDRSQMNSAQIAKDRETAVQRQTPDPAQAEAERQKRIEQLPPEFQALIRDRSQLDARTAEKRTGTADRTAELQRRLEEARRKKMSPIASPNAEASDTQATSPAPSPTPE